MTYIIAEIGANHNGSMHTAKKLIDEAQNAGASAVKFQSWSPSSLYSGRYLHEHPQLWSDLEKYHLSNKKLRYLANYAKIDFICSVFSRREVDELEDVVDFYKIASMDVTNHRLLKRVASKRKPVIMSCGMASIDEVAHAVEIMTGWGKPPLTLLHCVSLYPAGCNSMNLGRMDELRKLCGNVGLSDHSLGITVSLAACALGAQVIEKHFTLDKCQKGFDHVVSIEPYEMKDLVRQCELINSALGTPAVKDTGRLMRRSWVANADLKKGQKIAEQDIIPRRPGIGIPVDKNITGKKMKRNLFEGTMLKWRDLK